MTSEAWDACICGKPVHSVNLLRVFSVLTRTRWPVFALVPVLVMMLAPHIVGVVALGIGVVLVLLRLGRMVPWRKVAWHLRPLSEPAK